MNRIKCWVVTLCMLFVGQFVFGQTDRIYRPKLSVKYNPLAFLNHTPGIELGVERTIAKNASIHLGASLINDFGIPADQDFSGYKLIGEYRFFSPFTKQSNNTFIALQFNYKRVTANGRTYLDRANGNYQQLTDITVENRSLDFLGAVGKVYPIRSWLSCELSLVAGAKKLNLTSDDIPDDAFLNLSADNIFAFSPNEPGIYWYPVFRLQVKFNFEIN